MKKNKFPSSTLITKSKSFVYVSLFLATTALSPALIQATTLPIDTFEEKTSLVDPEWWILGSPSLTFKSNEDNAPKNEDSEDDAFMDEEFEDDSMPKLGKTSLSVTGKADMWYLGGMGTFLATDPRGYNALEFTIYGNKQKGGRLKIELYDDDNGNWKIEPSKRFPSKPGKDDKFSYFIELDWDGWKKITIPFKHFLDENKNIGDGRWNPYQRNGSGGLIQMQLIFFSNTKKGKIDVDIDAIQFVKTDKFSNDLN